MSMALKHSLIMHTKIVNICRLAIDYDRRRAHF